MGRIRAIIHNKNKEVVIKIEKYNEFGELPLNIQKKNKKEKDNTNILWLAENNFYFISEYSLISKINVFLAMTPNIPINIVTLSRK